MANHLEWDRFLHYMENEVRPQCGPQRASLTGGPFEWLQRLSGSAFGNKVGALVVRFFLEDEMRPRSSTGHDFVFQHQKVELKTGVEHSTAGVYLFQQIRPQQDWTVLLCLGLAVRQLDFYVLTRTFVERPVNQWRSTGNSVIVPQHGGAGTRESGADPDTFWLWTKREWDAILTPHRSRFDTSGWHGTRLQQALRDG